LAWPAIGIAIFSLSLLSGAIGLVAGLSTAVVGAVVVVVVGGSFAGDVVPTGVESLPGVAAGASGEGVASLAGVPGAVVESIGVVILISGAVALVKAVRSFGGGVSLHAASAKAQQRASVSGCRGCIAVSPKE
jgi:hypothetical protein